MSGKRHAKWTREEVLEAMRAYVAEGWPMNLAGFCEIVSADAVVRIFGGWRALCAAVGVEPGRPGRKAQCGGSPTPSTKHAPPARLCLKCERPVPAGRWLCDPCVRENAIEEEAGSLMLHRQNNFIRGRWCAGAPFSWEWWPSRSGVWDPEPWEQRGD